MVHAMNTLMRECINHHAPLRRVKVTRPPAPWLKSDEIRKLQSERDVLRVRARKHNTEETWTAFRSIRNKIKSMISKAKRSFLVNVLSSKRSKEVWKIIHRVLHPNLKSLRADPNELNKYFISIATRTLGAKPDDIQDLFHQIKLLPETCELNRFSLRHITHGEVLHEISQLRSDCSTGYDQIPVRYVKLVKEYVTGPLMHIINICIDTSSFPQIWKSARISPIPKTDSPVSEKDYRPISILPVLSKIFERLVLKQLTSYIDQQTLLPSSISGFRKCHSTTTVLLRIRDDILHSVKRGSDINGSC